MDFSHTLIFHMIPFFPINIHTVVRLFVPSFLPLHHLSHTLHFPTFLISFPHTITHHLPTQQPLNFLHRTPSLNPYRIRIKYGGGFSNSYNKEWKDFTYSPSRCGLIQRKINGDKTHCESLWGVRFLQRDQPRRSL